MGLGFWPGLFLVVRGQLFVAASLWLMAGVFGRLSSGTVLYRLFGGSATTSDVSVSVEQYNPPRQSMLYPLPIRVAVRRYLIKCQDMKPKDAIEKIYRSLLDMEELNVSI